jgi:hypothetical protein
MRESIEAMREIWTKEAAEYHGEFVNFDPMIARPKPVQKPHPPTHVGGAFPVWCTARDPLWRWLDTDRPWRYRRGRAEISARWRGRLAAIRLQ